MELCISNIAWPASIDVEALNLCVKQNLKWLELAPPRTFIVDGVVSDALLQQRLLQLRQYHIKVASFQSLLFGLPALKLFASMEARTNLAQHLTTLILAANKLSCGNLVFGSPKNRNLEGLSFSDARATAVKFFRDLAPIAAKAKVTISIEANPTLYQCDFLTTTEEALSFVKDIRHDAIKLNFDVGTMIVNEEDPLKMAELSKGHIGHVHISNPKLQPLGGYQSWHEKAALGLQKIGYAGIVSIEMSGQSEDLAAVASSISFAKEVYACR